MRRRRLGILISAAPHTENFRHGVRLAQAAAHTDTDVYLYRIDQAVRPEGQHAMDELASLGVKLFVCAYSLRKLGLPLEGAATPSGLISLSDVIGATDRFVSFT